MQKTHNVAGQRVEVKKALSRAELEAAQNRGGSGGGSGGGRGNQWGGPQQSWNPNGSGGGGWGGKCLSLFLAALTNNIYVYFAVSI